MAVWACPAVTVAVPEHDEAVRLIRKAYELGCTFFDTAEGYGAGHNETVAGDGFVPFSLQPAVSFPGSTPPKAPIPAMMCGG